MNEQTRQVAIREAQRAYAQVARRYGDVIELATLNTQARRVANAAPSTLISRTDATDRRIAPLYPWDNK